MNIDVLDTVVLTGFKLDKSCYFDGHLREEYRSLQKRFGPRIFNNSGQSLDEIATDSGVTEETLRTELLNHHSKTDRAAKLKELREFHAGNYFYDVKAQSLDTLLLYYRQEVGIIDIDTYTVLLESVEVGQLEYDVETIEEL